MKGSFFYIILTKHYIKYGDQLVNLLGYGITVNPKKRSKQYSDHSGTEQEFSKLYYGSKNHITALETIIKQRVAHTSHKIYGQYVEWISPKVNMTIAELEQLVNDTIEQENFKIKKLQEEYLPFNNSDHHRKITVKEISINPDPYLENI